MASASAIASPCNTCGACCAYSAEWPRFTLENDDDIARLPSALVCTSMTGMRCVGTRCSALRGEVGVATSCSVYPLRPQVCRECQPGDDACDIARRHYGLPPIAAPEYA
ncbi:MAG: YkgJ family cysteine cluster protein [Hyphomicrobium sp.]